MSHGSLVKTDFLTLVYDTMYYQSYNRVIFLSAKYHFSLICFSDNLICYSVDSVLVCATYFSIQLLLSVLVQGERGFEVPYFGIFWCCHIFATLAQMAIVLFWPV